MSCARVNYIFLSVILCVLINTGSCLKCYNCVARSETDECMDPKKNNLEPQTCVPDKIKNIANEVNKFAQSIGAAIGIDIDKESKPSLDVFACQKIVTTVNNQNMTIRSCQLKDLSTDYCEGVKKQTGSTVTYCSLCEEEGCNAGNWLAPLSTFALLIPTVTFVIKSYVF